MSIVSVFKGYTRLAGIVLILLIVSESAEAETPKEESNPAKPSATVSFERQTIRQNDSIAVSIWFSNESNLNLKDVEVYIEAPDFLIWQDASCKSAITIPLLLGAVGANAIVARKLCIKTEDDVTVGSFNLAFTFKYSWEIGGAVHQSFVVSEKSLNSTLFGSDSVAGVPLNLAGFVVPGLFFWLVLSFLKVPVSVELPLGDRMIYSVIVSIGIIGVASWLKRIDTSGGIGIAKLARLAMFGTILGVVVSVVYYVAVAAWRRKARNKLIDPYDELDIVLEKLLRQNLRLPRTYSTIELLLRRNANRRKISWILTRVLRLIPRYDHHRVVVYLKEGGAFRGSLSATNNGFTWLVGWFHINIHGKSKDIRDAFREYEATNNLIEMVRLARTEHIEIETRQLIQVRRKGAPDHSEAILQWQKEEVVRTPRQEDAVMGPPIVLVEQQ